MSKFGLTELQRLRYHQGQLLRSRDFRDQLAIEAQLRWWHNRALHNTFGVTEGFEVKLKPDGGLITISPGVAYDCFGRELILQRERELGVPATVSEEMALLARYKETPAFQCKAAIARSRLPGTDASWEEQPEFFWKPSAQVEVGDGVPLAKLLKDGGTLDSSFIVPRSRPLARPRIGSGATIPGNTAWEVWPESVDIGFQVRIDTSAVGFTEVPCYFAWLQGLLWSQSLSHTFFLVPFVHIHEPSTDSFVFRIWMPELTVALQEAKAANKNFDLEFPSFAQKQRLSVCWLGIQPASLCGEESAQTR